MECKLWFCAKSVSARGYCKKHYMNWLRYNTPIAPSNVDLQMAMGYAETLSRLIIGWNNTRIDYGEAEELSRAILKTAIDIKLDQEKSK